MAHPQISWQYIAGFFDGEGTVGMCASGNEYQRFQASFAQSGKEGKQLLQALHEFLSAEGIRSFVNEKKTHIGNKPAYTLRVSSRRNVVPLLQKMLPYLRIKRVKTQDMLRYNTIFPDVRKRIYAKRTD